MMTHTPKNPNVDRVSDIPFDKDTVSPMPQYAPRAHGAGASGGPGPPTPPSPEKEEYPGPQRSSDGTRAEPGRRQPAAGSDA
jgi:hypothetical protein